MDARAIARLMALGRTALGTVVLLAPGAAGRRWVGDVARHPGARAFARGMAIRDIALGVGTFAALREGSPRAIRDWSLASALADGGDAVATLASWRHLPRSGRVSAVLMAGAATVANLVTAAGEDDERPARAVT